ncbi:helix-turn-helix domain-containing protein [Catenulispora yoronensis]|uniref:helix-turn-helix domain-containing protein n=1 Tax=Catenulispora yoronensis TaxID=450799 RepID=UPI0031E0AA47
MVNGNQLAAFLRARRARLAPTDVGLNAGIGLRRTPGLRREELASVAGVSVDYYIRLEQGRETNPSSAVLDALAAALRLNEEEHAHLYSLSHHVAQRTPPPSPLPYRASARSVRPGIRRLLETVRPSPAYVLGRYSDILAANPEGLALFAGLADWPVRRRNTLRYFFCHPQSRTLFDDWERWARSSVASMHSLAAEEPDAPELTALVEEFHRECPEFPELWARHEVRVRRGDAKRFHHPVVGELTLVTEVLRFGDDGQRMTVYQAEAGSADEAALGRLSATP